jgi:RNase adaptor protein for sRNA GlmZ degradation
MDEVMQLIVGYGATEKKLRDAAAIELNEDKKTKMLFLADNIRELIVLFSDEDALEERLETEEGMEAVVTQLDNLLRPVMRIAMVPETAEILVNNITKTMRKEWHEDRAHDERMALLRSDPDEYFRRYPH